MSETQNLNIINEQISNNIKDKRKFLKFKQKDIAVQLNISFQTYQRIESKPLQYPISRLIELADVLNCEYLDFFVGTNITKCDTKIE